MGLRLRDGRSLEVTISEYDGGTLYTKLGNFNYSEIAEANFVVQSETDEKLYAALQSLGCIVYFGYQTGINVESTPGQPNSPVIQKQEDAKTTQLDYLNDQVEKPRVRRRTGRWIGYVSLAVVFSSLLVKDDPKTQKTLLIVGGVGVVVGAIVIGESNNRSNNRLKFRPRWLLR